MTFHRFLEGRNPRLQIHIGTDQSVARVVPWDPFMEAHPATTASPPERLQHVGGTVEVQGFVLPHRDRMTQAEFEAAGGPDGWLSHQGFFIYRGERLLVPGGWLGLGQGRRWARDDLHKLARIRLDISNSVDEQWKVDIRKSSATPPASLKPRLQALAEEIRKDAREVFAFRGGRSTRQASTVQRVWTTVTDPRGTFHVVDRQHPMVKRVLDAAGPERRAVEDLLTLLESTLPVQRIWLDVAQNEELPSVPTGMPAEQANLMLSLYRHLRLDLRLSADDARARLLSVEPFSNYTSDVSTLPDTPR
jgi:hypothetical protein